MQSSSMNWAKVRLKTATHSPTPRRWGLDGTVPVSERSVAVDKGEGAEPRLFPAFAPAPREQAHRRAYPAGEEEPGSERAGGNDRQLRAQLRREIHPRAQVVDRA